MIFGIFAYRLYKVREKRRSESAGQKEKKTKDKYLYFEEKKLL
jgi:hypothetical protein